MDIYTQVADLWHVLDIVATLAVVILGANYLFSDKIVKTIVSYEIRKIRDEFESRFAKSKEEFDFRLEEQKRDFIRKAHWQDAEFARTMSIINDRDGEPFYAATWALRAAYFYNISKSRGSLGRTVEYLQYTLKSMREAEEPSKDFKKNRPDYNEFTLDIIAHFKDDFPVEMKEIETLLKLS